MGLEGAMFDEFLESVRNGVVSSCQLGWLDFKADPNKAAVGFPPYLSASLLAIARCRAQVEQTLGSKVRRSEGATYQHIAMATVADGVAEAICSQIQERKMSLKVRQADRLANELQFLLNTLRKFLKEDTLRIVESTSRMLYTKAGRGGGNHKGPDGKAALEELDRLGRVYVLCLGD